MKLRTLEVRDFSYNNEFHLYMFNFISLQNQSVNMEQVLFKYRLGDGKNGFEMKTRKSPAQS